jgi:hypothetical protein
MKIMNTINESELNKQRFYSGVECRVICYATMGALMDDRLL